MNSGLIGLTDQVLKDLENDPNKKLYDQMLEIRNKLAFITPDLVKSSEKLLANMEKVGYRRPCEIYINALTIKTTLMSISSALNGTQKLIKNGKAKDQ